MGNMSDLTPLGWARLQLALAGAGEDPIITSCQAIADVKRAGDLASTTHSCRCYRGSPILTGQCFGHATFEALKNNGHAFLSPEIGAWRVGNRYNRNCRPLWGPQTCYDHTASSFAELRKLGRPMVLQVNQQAT